MIEEKSKKPQSKLRQSEEEKKYLRWIVINFKDI